MAATVKTFVNNATPYFEDDDANGIKNENNNLIVGSGQTLDDSDNQQTNQAVSRYASRGDFYTDSGLANTLVLTTTGSFVAPSLYEDGQRARCIVNKTNTGNVTVNTGGGGVVSLKIYGREILSGELVSGDFIEMFYLNGIFNIFIVDSLSSASFVSKYEIGSGEYENKNLSITAQDATPHGLAFSSDGTKCYSTGTTSNTIYQYTLSTAWDISTGSYSGKSLAVTALNQQARGLAFSSDGTKCYSISSVDLKIYQYTLSTAWDISTGSYASKTLLVAAEGTPHDLTFSQDGTKCYVIMLGGGVIYQYTLSTAWDISTGSYSGKSFSPVPEDANTKGLFISDNGMMLFAIGTTSNTIYQYTLSTAWDISTGSYYWRSLVAKAQTLTSEAIFLGNNGSKAYILGATDAKIYQYNTTLVRQR